MENVKGTEKTERARNWTFIFYPGEGRADFMARLENLCVPGCVSPLHSPEGKKKHYHIIISGDKKTELQIKNEICKDLGDVEIIDGKETIKGVTKPQRIVNLRSAVRYMLHLDNPKKEQFDSSNPIIDFGGFDSSKYLVGDKEKKEQKYSTIKDVIRIIRETGICSLIELLDFLSSPQYEDLFYVCCENAYLCTQLTNSYNKLNKTVDKMAKEVLNGFQEG